MRFLLRHTFFWAPIRLEETGPVWNIQIPRLYKRQITLANYWDFGSFSFILSNCSLTQFTDSWTKDRLVVTTAALQFYTPSRRNRNNFPRTYMRHVCDNIYASCL